MDDTNRRIDNINTGLGKGLDGLTRSLQDRRSDRQDMRSDLHGRHDNPTRHLESHFQKLGG